LLCFVLPSALIAPNTEVSASRAMLLMAHIGATMAVAILVADRKDLLPILARGALIALVCNCVFDLAEGLWWVGRGPETLHVGSVLVRFGELQRVGVLARFAG